MDTHPPLDAPAAHGMLRAMLALAAKTVRGWWWLLP